MSQGFDFPDPSTGCEASKYCKLFGEIPDLMHPYSRSIDVSVGGTM